MDHYSNAPKKFTLKINKYCNCIFHENTVRQGLKMIGDIDLISINLKRNTYTLSTIKNPTHVIQALQHLLQKEVVLVSHKDPFSVKSNAPLPTGIIINAEEIPEFLEKVSKNENLSSVDICIRFNLKENPGFNQNVLHGNGSETGGPGDLSMVGFALPPPAQTNITPSAPVVPQQEDYVYGNPVTTRPAVGTPRPYYHHGLSTSSDDYPKDYPCTIL